MGHQARRIPALLALLATGGLAVGLLPATAGSTGPPAGTSHTTAVTSATWPTPTHVHVAATTATSVTVAWRSPPAATRFRVAWSDDEAMTDRLHKRVRHRHATLRDLEPGASAWVLVRVVRLDGVHRVGPASTPVEVVTVGQAPTEPPPPPDGETLFGANYTTVPAVNESVYEGRARAARIFFQELDSASFAHNGAVQEALADGVRTFVISWKETDLTVIKTFLAGIPDGLTVYTTFNHEPEDDHGDPGSPGYVAWSAEYQRQWSLQSPVMRAAGTIPTNILMAWTLNPHSGRDVADWTPPAGTVDVFAFDAYYGSGKDPATMVARMAAATTAAGLTTSGVGETGAPASDPQRVANTAEMRSEILQAGCFAWALYWGSTEGGFDSRMDDATADAWFG